jgi:hypothetical protein
VKLAIIVAVLATAVLAGQERKGDPPPAHGSASAQWRTPWGHPDLQGVWTNATDTPLERPASLAEQQVLSPEELRRREKAAAGNLENEPAVRPGDPGTYNAFWRDPIRPTTRTSLIVDPPDGRIPALTPEALKRRAERALELKEFPFWRADNPEERPFFERCIGRGWPRVGGTYQSTYQIFQNPTHVVLLAEVVNELHVIPLDGRPHGALRQWMGDARGHWEGDTLVVETINFPDEPLTLLAGVDTMNYPYGQLGGSAKNLRIIERYRRVDANTLDYQFTIHDPTTFTRPWTVSMPMRPAAGLYEYSCHEGNYGMMNVLRGARTADTEGKKKTTRR